MPRPDAQAGVEASPLDNPRVQPDSYVVYPEGYDEFVNSDKPYWCLSVVNGHAWGWSIRRGMGGSGPMSMNRKGEWIIESRGSGRNKPRRWSLEEALTIALEHADTHVLNGCTARQASEYVAARMAARGASA